MYPNWLEHCYWIEQRPRKGLYTCTTDSAFTPPYRRTHARVGMVPQQNNEESRPAWANLMSAMWSGRGDAGTLNDWMSDIGRCTQPPFRWGWSHHFSVQWTQSSFLLPEGFWPHQGRSHMILDRAPEENNNNNNIRIKWLLQQMYRW